jgi:hypothetical protein
VRGLASALLLAVVVLLAAPAAGSATEIVSGPSIAMGGDQVTIYWYTDVSASTEVAWGPDRMASFAGYPNTHSSGGPVGVAHSVTLRGLKSGRHFFRIRGEDSGGNVVTSPEQSFNVQLDGMVPDAMLVPDGPVNASVISGSTLFLGGSFTSIARRSGSGVAFDSGTALPPEVMPEIRGTVRDSIRAPDGSWFVAGDFTRAGAWERNDIARILPDGGIDPHWSLDFMGTVQVNALAFDGDTLYIGGTFQTVNGYQRQRLVAVDYRTAKLVEWNPSINGDVNSIAVADDKIIVGGSFTSIAGQPRARLAAFDRTTRVLTSWAPAASATVFTVDVEATTAYVGGAFTTIDGTGRNYLAAISTIDGSLQAWNPGANSSVYTLDATVTDVYVGGAFTLVSGAPRSYAAALDPVSGSIRPWNPTLVGTDVQHIRRDGGSIHVAGTISSAQAATRHNVARFDATTGLVDAWTPLVHGAVYTVLQDGARTFVGGSFASTGVAVRRGLASVDLTTGNLTAWAPTVTGTVNALSAGAGRVFIGGSFTAVNGTARASLARVDATTGALNAWNPGVSGGTSTVKTLAEGAGMLYVGGYFTTTAATSRRSIAKFNATTGALQAWNPNAGFSEVNTIAVTATAIYAGGTFSSIGGQARSRVAALDPASGLATAWNPGADDTVNVIAVQGNVAYVGGEFTTLGGESRPHLGAVTTDTQVVTPWEPLEPASGISALSVSGDTIRVGATYFALSSTLYPWEFRDTYVEFATDGTLLATDPQLKQPDSWASGVTTIAASGEHLFLGGGFEGAGIDCCSDALMHPFGARYVVDRVDAPNIVLTKGPRLHQTPTQVSISWRTSAPATSEIAWDVAPHDTWGAYANTDSYTDTHELRHGRTLTGLSPGTYHYRVRSVTSLGDIVVGPDRTFEVRTQDGRTPLLDLVVDGRVESGIVHNDIYFFGGEFNAVGTRKGSGTIVDAATGVIVPTPQPRPQFAGEIRSSFTAPDGSTLVAGNLTSAGGLGPTSSNGTGVVRLLPDGSIDGLWEGGSYDADAVVEHDGIVYAIGEGYYSGPAIAALDADTGAMLGSTLEFNTFARIHEAVIDGDTLYVGGDFTQLDGQARSCVAAVDLVSFTVLPWAPNPNCSSGRVVNSIAIDGSSVYLGGSFTTVAGQPLAYAAEVSAASGAPDATWDPVVSGEVGGLVVDAGGVAIASSTVSKVDKVTGATVQWSHFLGGGRALEMVATGSVAYVGGSFLDVGGTTRRRAAAFDLTSGALIGWNPDVGGDVLALSLTASGVFAGGSFSTLNNLQPRASLAAIDTTTGTLTAWAPQVEGNTSYFGVNTLAVRGTTIYVGGSFDTVNGAARRNAAAVNASTGANLAWNPQVGSVFDYVLSFVVDDTAGIVYTGGHFGTVSALPRSNLAAINAVTGVPTAWNPAVAGDVRTLELGPTALYAGGSFTTVNGSPRLRVAAFDRTTTALTAFSADANSHVMSLRYDSGSLFASGNFTSIGGQARRYLASLDPTSGAPTPWSPSGPITGANEIATTPDTVFLAPAWLDVHPDAAYATSTGNRRSWVMSSIHGPGGNSASAGTIVLHDGLAYLGGSFGTINGVAQSGLAVFDACGVPGVKQCEDEGEVPTISVAVQDASVALPASLADAGSIATTSIDVTTNAVNGYSLSASMTNSGAMRCSVGACTGSTIPSLAGGPRVWPAAERGFTGISVLDATFGRGSSWGPVVSTVDPLDVVNNRYVGLPSGYLFGSSRYNPDGETETIDFAIRSSPAATTPAGAYAATITFTVVASP